MYVKIFIEQSMCPQRKLKKIANLRKIIVGTNKFCQK